MRYRSHSFQALAPVTSRRAVKALAVALAITATALVAPAQAEQKPATLTLQGRGEISVTPDMAVVTTRVVTMAQTAPEALQDNTAAMTKVIADLKAAGVDDKDLQTSGFSISPRYDDPDDRKGRPPKIVGYDVSNGVTAKIRDLNELGIILEAVVASGANSIGGISFTVSDTTAKLDQARQAAVADARRKAELLTAAAGVKLGRVLSIAEGSIAAPRPYAVRMEKAMALAAAPVPVEAGEETLSATVSIVWELAN